jgi:uncharacterized protein involved in response to NO
VNTISTAPRPLPRIALFDLGFRPFYLLAAFAAASSVPIWVAQYFGLAPRIGGFAALAWHGHEMVYGFAVAVITGFLFTAVPNWTGLPTPTGRLLALLAALWLAGRVVMLAGPAPMWAVVDIAFLPVVAWAIWRPLRRSGNRNQFFVAILGALALINVAFHLAAADVLAVSPLACVEAGLALIVLIVTIMAGRVTPAFTRNAIPTARIRQVRGLDVGAIGSVAATLFGWVGGLPGPVLVPLAVLAAVLNSARLWCWDPLSTRGRPILWILHLSYAWIPIGMLLLALARAGIAGSEALAIHAVAVGGIGGMVIGMMTRTARGHTGRPLKVGPAEVTAYVLVHVAALTRVFIPLLWPTVYAPALVLSAALWSTAFVIYLIAYLPMLARAHSDGKPG